LPLNFNHRKPGIEIGLSRHELGSTRCKGKRRRLLTEIAVRGNMER
jgi:hypothetical protein